MYKIMHVHTTQRKYQHTLMIHYDITIKETCKLSFVGLDFKLIWRQKFPRRSGKPVRLR